MSRYIGSDIGGYRVIEPIGSGGMAKVFKAYQPSMDRFVALKILPEHYAEDATYLARFTQEAKVIARLEHRHIVPVYDFGEDRGTTYLTMRYLRAGTLKDLLLDAPGGRLSLPDAARIIGQVAGAVDYAHQQGIIHRDVKPANILIDMQGDAYLTDFGIAKVLEETGHLTSTGGILGTPAYMSPEQGSGKPVDGRTDVYSLGIILYQMLTGRVPYDADTPVAVVLAHVNEPLTLPSAINPDIPEEIEKTIFKALAKNPDDRYPTAGALAAELEETVTVLGKEAGQVNASSDLLGLSTGLAEAKPSDEVTRDVRIAAKKKPRQPGTLSPWVIGTAALAVIVLVAVGAWFLSSTAEQAANAQATAVALDAMLVPARTQTEVAAATATRRAIQDATATQYDSAVNATVTQPIMTLGKCTSMLAEAGVAKNTDWTPCAEERNGVLMALVPAGCFQMGSSNHDADERPVHDVCFAKPFWIDIYEVTNGQYGSIGCTGTSSGPDQPRNCVSWTDASAYCEARGARLPTEAEWEYAARGPDRLVYPWGNEFVGDNVTYRKNSGGWSADVGSKPGGMSWVGALDLTGNVWEWVSDWYGSYPSEQQVDPTGPASGNLHVAKGGSWFVEYGYLHTAYRGKYDSFFEGEEVGFRCAHSY